MLQKVGSFIPLGRLADHADFGDGEKDGDGDGDEDGDGDVEKDGDGDEKDDLGNAANKDRRNSHDDAAKSRDVGSQLSLAGRLA